MSEIETRRIRVSLAGIVTTSAGSRVTDARITAQSDSSSAVAHLKNDGTFYFLDLKAGHYKVKGPRAKAISVDVELSSSEDSYPTIKLVSSDGGPRTNPITDRAGSQEE